MMDLAAMIEEMIDKPEPVKTVEAILQGEIDKIDPQKLDAFATLVLEPLQGKLQELIDNPRRKALWRQGLIKTPNKVLVGVLDGEAIDDHNAFALIAEAMMKYSGKGQEAFTMWRVRGVVRSYYERPKREVSKVLGEYMAEGKRKSDAVFSAFIGIGCAEIIGQEKAKFLPLREATKVAARFLLRGDLHEDALGHDGGVVEW